MRVELPRLLSVFAHELRGPLSIIQGYLRLMLRQRDASHSETPMIRAMLDATGRLAALGRQASNVAIWANPTPTATAGSVSIATLAEKAAALVPSALTAVALDAAAGLETVQTSDADALAGALAALAESTSRDANGPVRLAGRSERGQNAFTFQLRATAAEGAADGAPAPPRATTIAFDRGGFGLSLVLASYVLAAHGAQVHAADDGQGLDVRLQKAGGSK